VNWSDPLRVLYWICVVSLAAWLIEAYQSSESIARIVGHV